MEQIQCLVFNIKNFNTKFYISAWLIVNWHGFIMFSNLIPLYPKMIEIIPVHFKSKLKLLVIIWYNGIILTFGGQSQIFWPASDKCCHR